MSVFGELESFGKAIGDGLNGVGEFVRSTGDLAGLDDIVTVGQRGSPTPVVSLITPMMHPCTARPMPIPTGWVSR
jgi:hypothetical protein